MFLHFHKSNDDFQWCQGPGPNDGRQGDGANHRGSGLEQAHGLDGAMAWILWFMVDLW